MTLLRPMLAARTPEENVLKGLPWPLWASPKVDGIRALVCAGRVLSRSMKLIPSRYVQETFGKAKYEGLDGELLAPNGAFRETTSRVMSANGGPVQFATFDLWDELGPYESRLDRLVYRLRNSEDPYVLDQILVPSYEELLELEAEWLRAGYEGVILRSGSAIYKQGRSTLRELALVKVKRFKDAEAMVVDAVELYRNENAPTRDERGYMKRSSHQLNKRPAGILGTLVVQNAEGQRFEIGTGFTENERERLWYLHSEGGLVGLIAKYKHLPQGGYDVPRHAVFLGFRAPIDH